MHLLKRWKLSLEGSDIINKRKCFQLTGVGWISTRATYYLSHDLAVGELYVIYSHVHDWIRASYNEVAMTIIIITQCRKYNNLYCCGQSGNAIPMHLAG